MNTQAPIDTRRPDPARSPSALERSGNRARRLAGAEWLARLALAT